MSILAGQTPSPTAVYIIGTVVGGILLGALGWFASTLLKHAQIIAIITAALPQVQGDIRLQGAQISALQTDNARLEGILQAHGWPHGISMANPHAPPTP